MLSTASKRMPRIIVEGTLSWSSFGPVSTQVSGYAVTRDLGGKSELTTIHKERRKASAVSANRILRHLSAPLGTIHGTRGAIMTKKLIPNSVNTARNIPVNVSRSTTTVVLRSKVALRNEPLLGSLAIQLNAGPMFLGGSRRATL